MPSKQPKEGDKNLCPPSIPDQSNSDSNDEVTNTAIYSPSSCDLPVAALAAWHDLPELVRNDPCLSPFRRGYERHLAGSPAPDDAPDAVSSAAASAATAAAPASAAPRAPVDGSTDEKQQTSARFRSLTPGNSNDDISVTVDEERKGRGRIPFPLAAAEASPKKARRCFLQTTAPLSPVNDADGGGDDNEGTESGKKKTRWYEYIKIALLLAVWCLFTVILMMKSEKVEEMFQISIPENGTRSYWILDRPLQEQISIVVQGALLPSYYSNMSSKQLSIWVEVVEYKHYIQLSENLSSFDDNHVVSCKKATDEWIIPIISNKDYIDFVPEVSSKKNFPLKDLNLTSRTEKSNNLILRLQMRTNMDASFPLAISYDLTPIDTYRGQIYGGVVLLGLYVLIVTETLHRALAAMVASTMSVAILAAMDERPTMGELVSWIDVETLLLLFSMMVLVGILAETGIFDYLAVFAYQITNGRIWPLINTLCLFTALLSSFLDNVTTVLLMTPVTIRLCEVMGLNPVPILMAMTMYSNIGGALTPVGDPPNAIIASNADVRAAGVDFGVFTLHMGIGVVLALILINIYLRLKFKNISDLRFTEPQDVQELQHEIAIWQRAAASLSSYSKDEDIVRRTLLRRVGKLKDDLKHKMNSGSVAVDTYRTTLDELKSKYKIRDKVLLVKSGIAVLFVVVFFFLHSIPDLKLSLGWTALLGAILLLLLTADNEIMESVLNRIEWGTLLFFASLFVLMEALTRLGLIQLVGWVTESFVLALPVSIRLSGSIVFVLLISALASSFVDNIPLTTMMVRIVASISQNSDIGLPLQPLVWALAFGACLGGNGTLIGSSANMVCAGVAEQHGYKFTFIQYFKLGFPITIISVSGAAVYLLIAHVAFSWH